MNNLIDYMATGFSFNKRLTQQILSSKCLDPTGETSILNNLRIFKQPENSKITVGIMHNYISRTLPMHDGIMEKTPKEFYDSDDEIMQMEYVISKTFIIDELNNEYKYPEEYKTEFLNKFKLELITIIEHDEFDKLTPFTKSLFRSMEQVVNCYMAKLSVDKSTESIMDNIKKKHNIQ